MMQLTPFRTALPTTPTRLWDDVFGNPWQRLWTTDDETRAWSPSAEVIEQPDAYVIKAEVPGLEADDIEVNLAGDRLTLRGERKHESKREGEHYQFCERQYGAFERAFTFPTSVDQNHVDAEIANGILTIRVVKKDHGKSTKIKVKKK